LKSVKRLFMNGFAPNLIQTPRIRPMGNFYPQNSNPTKSKMAAAAILKITLLKCPTLLLYIVSMVLLTV